MFCVEFYIGRFKYLKEELDTLPNVKFIRLRNRQAVSVKNPGEPEHRYSQGNKNWKYYESIAQRRAVLIDQMNKLIELWNSNHSGSLENLSDNYVIRPNTDNPYDSRFWESLKNNANTYPNDNPVKHNGLNMRSVFEADTAQILEDLGIQYKYDVLIGDLSPDFSLLFSEYNRCAFIEAMGALDNPQYNLKNRKKYWKYPESGLYFNRDVLIIPADSKYRPDSQLITKMITVICDSLACQYVFRKTDL